MKTIIRSPGDYKDCDAEDDRDVDKRTDYDYVCELNRFSGS